MALNKTRLLAKSNDMDSHKILKDIRQAKATRTNHNFRLNTKLLLEFKKKVPVKEQGQVLEKLIVEFLKGLGVNLDDAF